MKKHLFWLALGVTVLSACTKTDVIEEGSQSSAIGFQSVINKATRAGIVEGDLTLKDFDQFSVYGYYTKQSMEAHPVQVFSGDLVTKSVTQKEVEGEIKDVVSWNYTDTRYWMPEATYYFYAYSCADVALADDTKGSIGFEVTAQDANLDARIDKRSLKINSYVCNETHQHDLICAFAENITGQASGNTPVKFTFRHALCKVSAEFVNDFPSGYTIEVSDVNITNFYDKANYNIRGNVWSGQERTVVNKVLGMPIVGNNAAGTTKDEGEAALKVQTGSVFLLPVSYDNANVSLQFTLTVKQGDDVFMSRTIQGTWKPEWAPGKAYKYTVHISGTTAKLEPIVFEASQDISDAENWNSDITTDMTFGII